MAVDKDDLSWRSDAVTATVMPWALGYALDCEENGVPTVDGSAHNPHMTLGACACAFSHRACWERVVATKRMGIVMEDDPTGVTPDFKRRVHQATSSV